MFARKHIIPLALKLSFPKLFFTIGVIYFLVKRENEAFLKKCHNNCNFTFFIYPISR